MIYNINVMYYIYQESKEVEDKLSGKTKLKIRRKFNYH